jgi:ATP-dependent helicase HrpA
LRLDKFPLNPTKDADWQQQIQHWWQTYQARVNEDLERGVRDPKVEEFRWALEELRVSLWAQRLRTPYPVSFKRLSKAWNEVGKLSVERPFNERPRTQLLRQAAKLNH